MPHGVGEELHSAAWKRPARLRPPGRQKRETVAMNISADDIVDYPPDVNLEAPINDPKDELSFVEEEIEAIVALIEGLKEKYWEYRQVRDKVPTLAQHQHHWRDNLVNRRFWS
jgi:hypothetical protein